MRCVSQFFRCILIDIQGSSGYTRKFRTWFSCEEQEFRKKNMSHLRRPARVHCKSVVNGLSILVHIETATRRETRRCCTRCYPSGRRRSYSVFRLGGICNLSCRLQQFATASRQGRAGARSSTDANPDWAPRLNKDLLHSIMLASLYAKELTVEGACMYRRN